MRVIRINSQGKIFYGSIIGLSLFDDDAVRIQLDEPITHNGRVFETPHLNFSTITGAMLESVGGGQSDLYMIETSDLPRVQEFQAMETSWLYGKSMSRSKQEPLNPPAPAGCTSW